MYNHNAGSTGVTQVRTRFYAYGWETSYDKYWDMTSSWGNSGSTQTGIPWGEGTQIYAYLTGIEDGYEFVQWHYTISTDGVSRTSTSQTLSINYPGSDTGTLHIWPEVEWVGIEEPEPTWTLLGGSLFSDLTDIYSTSHIGFNGYQTLLLRFSCRVSGVVQLYTVGSVDTMGYLCEGSTYFDTDTGKPTSYLTMNDDSNGVNFGISYNIDAGTEYRLYVRPYSATATGITRIYIVPPATPTTMIASNLVIGSNPTFSFTKFNSNVTETVTYDFYGLTGTIVSGNTASTYSGWTIPTTFYDKIPEATSGTITITVTTYNNGVAIGSEQYTYSVAIPEDACKPALSPVIKDIKPETLALTGDENILIKDVSMVEYALNAEPQNAATITYQSITNGSQTIEDLPQGIIDNPETGLFTITVIDSRGLMTTMNVEKQLIEYIKPTCHQKIRMEMSGEAEVDVNGSIFAGSFGAVENTIKIEVRHTQNDGTMGEWNDLSALLPEMNSDNTYNFHFTISGLDYTMPYTFQCRVSDKLYVVESQSYTVRWLPVFDWSQDDFNFNVPVNISADNLDMYNNTVLRYNQTANNTVLSAGGGHIYIRPAGTNDTNGEITIYPDGRVNFSGEVTVNGEAVGGEAADYIVEIGEEAMGTNGTWYWEKWNSGKAICWGQRNYGSISLSGSKQFSQTLPTDLFIEAPILTISNSYETGHALHASANNVSSTILKFLLYTNEDSTVSGDSTPVYHYIIGRWK